MNRRYFLVSAGVVGIAVTAGCLGGDDAPEEPEYDDWFAPVPHFEGFEDRTDQSAVQVIVGAGENGLLFDPPAITVTPGTAVTFEWTGEGGEHDVSEKDGEWSNPEGLVDQAGHTWERTFDEPGTHLYECWPHTDAGMRGGVFVDAHAD